MTHITGFERSQLLLVAEAVDDYVSTDNRVRFIAAFVDELDLAAAGFIRVAPSDGPSRLRAGRFATALQRPLPSDDFGVVATGEKSDRAPVDD